MDIEKEIQGLEHEVDALKSAFSQAGTSIIFQDITLEIEDWHGSNILKCETADGSLNIAFSGHFIRRLPSSVDSRWVTTAVNHITMRTVKGFKKWET